MTQNQHTTTVAFYFKALVGTLLTPSHADAAGGCGSVAACTPVAGATATLLADVPCAAMGGFRGVGAASAVTATLLPARERLRAAEAPPPAAAAE